MSEEFDPTEAAAKATGDFAAAGDDVDDGQQRDRPAPDRGGAETSDAGDESAPSTVDGVREFMTEPASKSHTEVDAGDFWDLKNGGRNRIALVASDYLGSNLPPRIYQLCVGGLEEIWKLLDDGSSSTSTDAGDDQEASDGDDAGGIDGVPSA